MSDYTQNIYFATKDSLTTGDPLKKIKGSEVDAEFAEISTAIASKENTANKGAANGYAPLDSGGLLATSYIPTSVQYLNASAARTAAESITTTGSHLSLYESDAADPLDRALLELNGNAVIIQVYDNSAAAWRTVLSGNVTSGNTELGNGTGTTTINGSSVTSAPLTVSGSLQVSTTLGVTGAATLSSTLNVTGAAVFGSTVNVTGALTGAAAGFTSLTVGGNNVLTTASSITESQITDSTVLTRNAGNETISGAWTISGSFTKSGQGRYPYLNGSTNTGGAITLSTAAASGTPANGDIWIQYTA